MKSWIIAFALTASGVAWAEGDPLEAASLQQVAAQAPGSVQIAPFFHGAGEKTDWSTVLEANKCYWFSMAAAGKVKRSLLYLWPPGANIFKGRERADAAGTSVVLAHCTTQSGMFKFQAKVEGEGSYVVGVFGKEAPKPADPPPVAAKVEVDVGPLCDKTAGGSAPGAKRVGDFFTGEGNSIGHDDRFDYTVMMEAGKCYWVIGCGEPDHVKAIALYLWGPNGKRITEAKSDNPNPMIGHCAKETGMYKAQAKITGGGGHIKVGVYTK